jgi:tetratricopeptide (TPR) repeat protein
MEVVMSLLVRLVVLGLLAALALAQQAQEPPEEDLSPAQQVEYVFNPLQAQKEVTVGNFYYKKGSYRAAALRYEEATKWNPGLADAYLKLGNAQAKNEEWSKASAAWRKYLELEPDGKDASDVKKQLQKAAKNGDVAAAQRAPTESK